MLNLALGLQCRAFRRIDDWRVLLLLTPWMLSRLLFADAPPLIPIPPDWTAQARSNAPYQVLGPGVSFTLLGQPQRGHLGYHPTLGHYLLQPICLAMQPYLDPGAVFERWNQVIRTRDENLARAQRDCPFQEDVSRRELFRRLKGSDTAH